MTYDLATYHTRQRVPLARDTQRAFLFVSKRPLRSGVVTLPGLLGVHGVPTHAGLTVIAGVFEVLGALAVVRLLGLESIAAAGAAFGLVVLDLILALVHMVAGGFACESDNIFVDAKTNHEKDKLAARARRMRLIGYVAALALILGGLGKAGFFFVGASADGTIAPAWTVTLALLYVLVAVLHIVATGTFAAALRLAWHVRRDYVAWRDADPQPPPRARGIELPRGDYRACERGNYWVRLRDDGATWELGCVDNLLDDELLDLANVQPDASRSDFFGAGHRLQLQLMGLR